MTDGMASLSADTIAALESTKRDCGLNMFGVTIGGDGFLSVLEKICNTITNLDVAPDQAAALSKMFR